ncbi:MAG: hypothetical protein RSD35_02080 [Oscillospiraceae bacterium]
MKKILFFFPAIISTIVYGLLAVLGGIGTIHPLVAVWLLLFLSAGALLRKAKVIGGIFGMIPALQLIYMGTQETGQIIEETPIGIIILLYYMVCIYFVYKKNVSKKSS